MHHSIRNISLRSIAVLLCLLGSSAWGNFTVIKSLPYTANQMGNNFSETLSVAGTNLVSPSNGINIIGHDIVLKLDADTITFGADGSENVYGVNFGSAAGVYNIKIIGGWLIHGIKDDTLSGNANCLLFQYPVHDVLIRGVNMKVSGDNGHCIDYRAEARPSYNIEVIGGQYWSACRRYTSREHYDGAVVRACFTGTGGAYNIKIHGVRIWNGPGQGIVAYGTWGSIPPNNRAIVYSCTISVDHRNDFYRVNEGPEHPVGHSSENPYAIFFSFCAPGSSIHDNVITSGTKYGGSRGICIESCMGSSTNYFDIYNNDVDVHEGPNIRVGEAYGSFALRMRPMEGQIRYIHVFNNKFVISGDSVASTKAYGHIPEALHYSNTSAGSHIIIENNLFKAYAAIPGKVESHAATFDAVMGADSTLVVRNNRFESDHVIVKFGGENAGASGIVMEGDTLARLKPSYKFATFEVGHLANSWTCTGNVMVDLTYLGGALDTNIHLTDGGTLDLTLKRTLAVQVVGRNSLPVPDAIVTATNAYGQMVLSGVSDKKGMARGLVSYWFVSLTEGDSTRFNDFTIRVGRPSDIMSAKQKVTRDCGPANIKLIKTDGVLDPQGMMTPFGVKDLAAIPADIHGAVKLTWTSFAYANSPTNRVRYEIRYSSQPITKATWERTGMAPDPPWALTAGTFQEYFVRDLNGGERYFFGLRAYDNAGNVSPISNIAETLATGIVAPVAMNTIVDKARSTVTLTATSVPSYMPLLYEFALDRSRSFYIPRLAVGTPVDTSVSVTFDSLRSGTDYFWRCRALSANLEDSSDWTVATGFDLQNGVKGILSNYSCLYPTSGATVQSRRPTFSVDELPNINMLIFQVANDSDFREPIESGRIQTRNGHPTYWRMNYGLPGSGVYFWRVSANNNSWTSPIRFRARIDIHPFPNPFNAAEGHKKIIFDNLPANCTINIINRAGKIIKKAAGVGPDDWVWDATDDRGLDIPAGTYLYMIQSGAGSISGRLTIIR